MLRGAHRFRTTHAANRTYSLISARQSQATVCDSDNSAALRPYFSHYLHRGKKKRDQVCKGL